MNLLQSKNASNLDRLKLIESLIAYVKEQQDLIIERKKEFGDETYHQLNEQLWAKMRKLIPKRNEIYNEILADIDSI